MAASTGAKARQANAPVLAAIIARLARSSVKVPEPMLLICSVRQEALGADDCSAGKRDVRGEATETIEPR